MFDAAENCTLSPNAEPRNTDRDGFGNLRDAVPNYDGFVTVSDDLILRIFRYRDRLFDITIVELPENRINKRLHRLNLDAS